MKGIAMMLKALWPDLDWSTPEKLFKNAIPQLDLNLIQTELLAALKRVERMEGQLERVLESQKRLADLIEGEAGEEVYGRGGSGSGGGGTAGAGTDSSEDRGTAAAAGIAAAAASFDRRGAFED
jgi:hypothetical protein